MLEVQTKLRNRQGVPLWEIKISSRQKFSLAEKNAIRDAEKNAEEDRDNKLELVAEGPSYFYPGPNAKHRVMTMKAGALGTLAVCVGGFSFEMIPRGPPRYGTFACPEGLRRKRVQYIFPPDVRRLFPGELIPKNGVLPPVIHEATPPKKTVKMKLLNLRVV